MPENRCGAPIREFERVKAPALADGQPSTQISTVLEAADGTIWFNNFGINQRKSARVLRWRADEPLRGFDASAALDQINGASDHQIYGSNIALARGGGGKNETLWLADRSGLLRFDGAGFVKELSFANADDDRFKFARGADRRLIVDLSGAVALLDDVGQ